VFTTVKACSLTPLTLEIKVADIGNIYLNAPTNEKIVITCGLEFGAQFEGRLAKIVRANMA